ncbi:MAG: hypothetical protein OXJ52_07555 [Oligoflexia bacterium]|nr:hypothetical protein [Oligoflexia bacterium]
MSYKEAQTFVREINIKTKRDFFKFVLSDDKPFDLPVNPNRAYKEWTSWEDFLGVESAGSAKAPPVKKENTFLEDLKAVLDIDKEEAKAELNHQIQEPSQKEASVVESSNRTEKISGKRNSFQRRNRAKNNNWMSYEEAKKLIQSLKITTALQFYEWSKENRPSNFPSSPYSVYKKEWRGWGDFLGTGRIVTKHWMSYEEAKALIQSEGVISEPAYRKWRKAGRRPPDFPVNPDRIYKEDWQSWPEFLGTVEKL